MHVTVCMYNYVCVRLGGGEGGRAERRGIIQL